MKKRIVSLLAVLCTLLMSLAACTATPATPQPEASQPQEQPKDDGPIVLTCKNPFLYDDAHEGTWSSILVEFDTVAHMEWSSIRPLRAVARNEKYKDNESMVEFFAAHQGEVVLSEDRKTAEITFHTGKKRRAKYDLSLLGDEKLIQEVRADMKAEVLASDDSFSAEEVEQMLNNQYGPFLPDQETGHCIFPCKWYVEIDWENRTYLVTKVIAYGADANGDWIRVFENGGVPKYYEWLDDDGNVVFSYTYYEPTPSYYENTTAAQ